MSARLRLAALVSGALLAASFAVPSVGYCVAAAPEAGGVLGLQTWVESGQLIIVTAVTVPESTKLPVTVRVPVPEGATVQWAGEVLGGDLSADPARPYKIIKSPVGGRYAEFTLEQTRSAQVDADMATVTVNGAATSVSFDWIQSVTSPSTSFSLRVPANAADVKFTPAPVGAPDTNESGERLYSGDELTLAPGQKQTVSFSYSAAPVSQTPAGATSGLTSLIYILVGALVVAVVVLIVVLARQRAAVEPAEQTASSSRTGSDRPESTLQASSTGSASDDDWGFDDQD